VSEIHEIRHGKKQEVQMKSAFFRLHKNGETLEDLAVLRFDGANLWLDEDTVQGIRASLMSMVENGDEARVIMDLGNVEYVSSSFLGIVISLHKKLSAVGKALEIRNLRPSVYEVFAVCGLDGFLDLLPMGACQDPSTAIDSGDSRPGVLVVDDDPTVLSFLKRGLEHQGIQVWTACNGPLALKIFLRHRQKIALVLLDVNMPGWDGPSTLSALRRSCPEIRFCFITGNPGPYSDEALLSIGALRVFRKPLMLAELLHALPQVPGWPARPVPQNSKFPYPGA
jgi:two-component system response regulator MprA